MFFKNVNLPILIQINHGALKNFKDTLVSHKLFFSKPLLLCGEKSSKILEDYDIYDLDKILVKEASSRTVDEIVSDIYGKGYDLIIAAGGGKVIDTGKMLSRLTLLPVISIPTILSSDSISSPISVLRVNDGIRSVGSAMPMGVIVDLDIIEDSPEVYLKTGLGDLISNISASLDWILAYKRGYESLDYFSLLLSLIPAERILFTFKDYGDIRDRKFIKTLAEGLIMSGVAMSIAGTSRPSSGGEHNIGHSLDRIMGKDRKPHGIQVGFSTLLIVYLHGRMELFDLIKKLFEKFHFPRTFDELGISEESFLKAVKLAPTIRNRYTILNEIPHERLESILGEVYSG
jgi:glycerol-1-phosphate dehydrogenase [NAD(P)+]